MPALDAVLFMSPRNSQVDIVQAGGRAMRKARGKTYGYIVLPVAVPAGVDPAAALDDNERVRGRVGRTAGATLPRRPVRRRDQPDRPEPHADEPHHLQRSRNRRGRGPRRSGVPSVRTARPATGSDLRQDRRQVRRPEVLGDMGEGCRRHLLAPRPADRRAARQPRKRRTAGVVRRVPRRVEAVDQRVDHPRRRHRHDGAAHPDAAGIRGAVRGVRLRRDQPRGQGSRWAAPGLR